MGASGDALSGVAVLFITTTTTMVRKQWRLCTFVSTVCKRHYFTVYTEYDIR